MVPAMAGKFDHLLAEVMRLSKQDRERFVSALKESWASTARMRAETRADNIESDCMTYVTVALPEDLAQQAQDAGLLTGSLLEELIRKALDEQSRQVAPDIQPSQERRLVRENGYLVVEALPGEKPITTEEVKKILDEMRW